MNCHAPNRRHRSSGYATVVAFALVGLMILIVVGNLHVLANLRNEVDLIDQRQQKILEEKILAVDTNLPPATVPSNDGDG